MSTKLWLGIQSILNKITAEKFRVYSVFTVVGMFYIFREGFWGMDFLSTLYSLLLLFPFFYLFTHIHFPKMFVYVLLIGEVVWLVWTHSFPIFWMIGVGVVYGMCWYFSNLKASDRKNIICVSNLSQLLKVEGLFILFRSIYEPMRETWYIEGDVVLRLYVFLAIFVFVYAGLVWLLHDWQSMLLLRREKILRERRTTDKRAI